MTSTKQAGLAAASTRARAPRLASAGLVAVLGLCLAAGSRRASSGSEPPEPVDVGAGERSPQSTAHIGYGVNPAYDPGGAYIGAMGFDWTKVWTGPDYRLPYRVLRRINVNYLLAGSIQAVAQGIGDEAWQRADYIEAWEIGNEVNLGAEFGWGTAPNAAVYTQMLCAIYEEIKAADPSVVVVSAGLAPVGRVPFTYNGHHGYCAPGLEWCGGWYQDEREYLREMLAAGAGNCFDALGYHPYGFLAPYHAAPGSGDCGVNDFCFRGVEPIHDIMVNEFGVDKPIWATEFGWIIDPAQVGQGGCLGDPSMGGFLWMLVSPQQQAANLLGAYQYADANYPWMGPMFLFNYGFAAGHGCNQMSFFDIQGRPAEGELTSMDENTVPAQPVWSAGFLMIEQGDTRVRSGALTVRNLSPEPIYWTASLVASEFPVTLTTTSGSYRNALRFTADPSGLLSLGTYTATVAVTVTTSIPVPVEGAVQTVPVSIRVVEEIFPAYLPLVARRYR